MITLREEFEYRIRTAMAMGFARGKDPRRLIPDGWIKAEVDNAVAALSSDVAPQDVRSAVSAWLTLALDVHSDGPSESDLLALRDWIDSGCMGEIPEPDVAPQAPARECPMCHGVGRHTGVPHPTDPARRVRCPNQAIEQGRFVRVVPGEVTR